MKKVAFLLYGLTGGGAEHMAVRLANAFSCKGIESEIIIFDDSLQKYKPNSNVKVINLGIPGGNRFGANIKRLSAIRKCLAKEKPEVVYAYSVIMLPFAILGKGRSGCKVIGSERTNPKLLKPIYRIVSRVFAPLCDGFVFQTKGAMGCYSNVVAKKSVVIGNIAPDYPNKNHSERYGRNEICTCGRLHSDKDYVTLIHAMKLVIKKIPIARLHIYGEGPQKEELHRLCDELGIAENVIFEGFSDSVCEEYRNYCVFAFSSKGEGMPNVLLEAMASGCACVATDCDFGPSELINDGYNGFLVPVGNSEIMADRMIKLVGGDISAEKIGFCAKESVKVFSESEVVTKYLIYTKKVLQQNG